MSIVKATIHPADLAQRIVPVPVRGRQRIVVAARRHGAAVRQPDGAGRVDGPVLDADARRQAGPIVTHMDGTGGDREDRHRHPRSPAVTTVCSTGRSRRCTATVSAMPAPMLSPLGFSTPRAQAEVLFYNLLNPDSIRSNPLQQAAEQLMFTRALKSARACRGASFGRAGGPCSRRPVQGDDLGPQPGGADVAHDRLRPIPSISGVISSSGSGGQYHTLAHSPRRLNTISLVTNYADRLDELNPLIQVVQTVFEASDGANFATDHQLPQLHQRGGHLLDDRDRAALLPGPAPGRSSRSGPSTRTLRG